MELSRIVYLEVISLSGLCLVLLALGLSSCWLFDLHDLVIGDPALSAKDFENRLTVLIADVNNCSGLLWFYVFVDDHVYEPCSDSIADSGVLSLDAILFIWGLFMGLNRIVWLLNLFLLLLWCKFLMGNFFNLHLIAILDTYFGLRQP